MNGIIYYFSGTGNTKWAAEKIKKRLEHNGNIIEICNIEKVEEISLEGQEILIIGTPVHAEVAPKLIMDFVSRMPENTGIKRCLLFSTQGAKSAAATELIKRVLEKKGYKVDVQAFVRLPNNYYFGAGIEPSEVKIKELFIRAEAYINKFVDNFINNKGKLRTVSFLRASIGELEGKMFYKFLPKLSKAISATDKCTKCGICLRNCPKGNITFEEGRAVFHSNCIMCTRCIHLCPINAISYKNKKVKQTQRHIINILDVR